MKSIGELKSFLDDQGLDYEAPLSPGVSVVDAAERFLNVRFPIEFREFLLAWGTLSVESVEIYGVVDGDFVNSSIPDAVWLTARKRRQLGFPANLVIIFDNNGDEYVCIDCNVSGNCLVVGWDTGDGETSRVIANSLVEYISRELADLTE